MHRCICVPVQCLFTYLLRKVKVRNIYIYIHMGVLGLSSVGLNLISIFGLGIGRA